MARSTCVNGAKVPGDWVHEGTGQNGGRQGGLHAGPKWVRGLQHLDVGGADWDGAWG